MFAIMITHRSEKYVSIDFSNNKWDALMELSKHITIGILYIVMWCMTLVHIVLSLSLNEYTNF